MRSPSAAEHPALAKISPHELAERGRLDRHHRSTVPLPRAPKGPFTINEAPRQVMGISQGGAGRRARSAHGAALRRARCSCAGLAIRLHCGHHRRETQKPSNRVEPMAKQAPATAAKTRQGVRSGAPKRKTKPRKGAGGRATHDVGGLDFGAIDRSEHDLALWEKRTDAMLSLLHEPRATAPLPSTASARDRETTANRSTTAPPTTRNGSARPQPARRAGMSDARGDRGAAWPRCGRRHAKAGRKAFQGQRCRGERRRSEPRHSTAGAALCAGRSGAVAKRPVLGHCRTPWYLRGKTGVVVAVHGRFRDPERLAYHRPGLPAQVLYKVRFQQRDVWGRLSRGQRRPLEADIYEHWLEPTR